MKVRLLLISLICCMAVCGCGINSDKADVDLKKTEVKLEGTTFGINDAMVDVKEKLGEPIEYSESKSCLYDGYDKTYTYEDVIIITYPMEQEEYISSITILSNDVETGCDIKIGDTVDSIKDLWGEEDFLINNSCYMLEDDDYGIACYAENDVVAEIEIYAIAE